MPAIFRLSASVGAGLLLAASFEPLAMPVCAVLGLTLLSITVTGCPRRRDATFLGGVAGLAFFGTLLVWLWPSVGVAAWIALSLAEAMFIAAWALACHVVRTCRWHPLVAASLWSAIETTRGTWPWGGMPWGRIGFAVVDSPWSAWLPYAGVTGTGFILALTGFGLGAVWLRSSHLLRRRLLVSAVIVTASVAPLVFPWEPAPDDSLRIAIVQGDVPGDGRTLSRYHRAVTSSQARLTQTMAADVARGLSERPDLVVWPENSTAVDPFEDVEARTSIQSAAEGIGAPLLVGAIVDGDSAATARNQSILWTPQGPSGERYTKRHLVPFGEYIPLRRWLGNISPRLSEIGRDMVPGSDAWPMAIGRTMAATALCFDVGYDDVLPLQVRRGGTLAVVQTSNAMFTGTSQLDQQFAISRARAIETGRTVVVASVNGISGVIGPDGAVIERLPVRSATVSVSEVELSSSISPAVRWGSWPARLATLLGLGAVLVSLVSRRPRRDG